MHNALRWFLLWTLFPFVIVAADPPPPLVRSVLSTNLPPFGLTGQALFRTANLPYLDWSNIVQQVIDTNAFQPASANLTNWSLISTNALTGKLDSNVWWAAWGSLDTNALTGKLDSNYWFTVWGAIGTNALTAKLDSNWWWTAYGGKVLTNGGAFIGSASGFGTNTTFRGSSDPTGGTILISTNPGYAGSQISVVQGTNNPYVSLTDLDYNGYLMNRNVRTAGRAFSDISSCTSVSNVPIFNAYCSYDATATGYGTDWNHFRGFQARPVWMGSGFVQAIQGFYFQPQTWAPAASVYGVYFDNPLGTNFVTNYVAFWMPQFTATNIINKFGIYFADPTFPSYHAGTWQTGTNIIAGGDFQGLNIISAAAFGTIGVGRGAGIQATPGFYETHLGYLAGRGINNSGIYNTLIGNQSGYTLTANSGNTFLGSYSGYNNNGHSNLFIGRDSGYYETGNNKLFIDNGRHASEADARTKALVYGTFGLSPELQNFSINAKVGVNTNAAAAWLHVTGDNSANNVVIVDTTNNHSLLVITTNGLHGFNTNNPQAVFDFFAQSNGPSQYIFRVANGMVANQTNLFVILTNGLIGIGKTPGLISGTSGLETAGQLGATGDLVVSGFSYLGGSGAAQNRLIFGTTSARGNPSMRHMNVAGALNATIEILSADGNPYPSNNLFAAGQLIGSNGVVARVHSTYATNVPPLSVEPFTGQATNAMQVLGTNRTTMIVDSNGVTQVNPGGGLNPVGCYGALMMNSTNIVVCAGAASVYTNIAGTGYTTIVTNGFYGDTNGNSSALTNLYAGYYRVQASVSYVGANAGAYEAEVFTNNVSCDLIGWKDTFDTPARLRNGGAAGIIYLPAGCRTSVRIQDGGAGTSIAIQRTSLVIGTP